MRAKSFFYLCTGLFLIAFGYHLGARTATAQSDAVIGTVEWQFNTVDLVVDRVAYRARGGQPVQPLGALPPIPGSSAVIAFSFDTALLANGDVYDWTGSNWRYDGNVVGGPTPARQESMGAVKVRYR